MRTKKALFMMGVSGVGKSTIAHLLSKQLDIPYFDGDDYHPQENINKMSRGEPLNDDDRKSWLIRLNQLAKEQLNTNSCIIACSALKEKYRLTLSNNIHKNTEWIYLYGTYEQILERIQGRSNHFMPAELLKSQFDVLEEPKQAIKVNIALTPDEIVENIKMHLKQKSDFGLLGLGVMGKSLARNLAQKGFKLSLFNRHIKGVEENVAKNFKNNFPELNNTSPFDNIECFVNSIEQPRKIMLMVNAGSITDTVIQHIIPYLSEGDIIIDGGNSHFEDTEARSALLKSKNIHFIGAGISGGEEGALNGPSIMPSGDKDAYKKVQPYFEAIAAQDNKKQPCCTYIGESGSGHFVKMVHNGIEYVEMQLLAEVCTIFKHAGLNYDETANTLELWKESTNSYLLEITVDILRKKEGNDWLLNKILDKAGNKGTGNWTTITAAQLGIPATLIASALFARYTSTLKTDRIELENSYLKNSIKPIKISSQAVLKTYQVARIINHFQGFNLISEASKSYGWDINLSELSRIWTNGCIIRSTLMEDLVNIFKETTNLLTHHTIIKQLLGLKPETNTTVATCIQNEIPLPCISEALNFINNYTCASSTTNIIQAQRDYFGAHTYQRIDDESGKSYHTIWNE